ncbi:uncharacterized protein LOC128713791 [Anopheles marshallii]|uniref:uncharacterized protein LOC128713791 n=1 Tax=Anopheles marshallii TaxID=1521116 RepID=UPI00237AF04E|nr:uncharacterized protein LOC128713791 [Anopheles marshallii]
MVIRGVRGGYHSRGGGSRGAGRSTYHGGSGYHGSNHHNSSSYDNRNDNRNSRYSSSGGSGGGGGGYDSRNSSRYESDSRYSRHESRNDNYKRSNSSKYEDNRDRRSPDRKRPRSDHNTQGGSSRRDYGSSGSGAVGGRGGGSSSRYHEGGSSSSSYDKRGSNEHHSSSSGAADSSNRSKFDHHRSSSSASRSHGGGGGSGGGGGGGDSGSSYRSRDNSSTSMGPPRSVAMRSNHSSSSGGRSMMRPPMGGGHRSHIGGSSLMGGGGMHRRGSGMMRGRISHYRSDGRRGMLTSRIMGGHHRPTDMRPIPMHNRRFPSIRGRGDMRSRIMGGSDVMSKRTFDMRISKKVLYKRALQAAKDGYDESASENDDDDEEDDGDDVEAAPSRTKKAKKTDVAVEDEEEEVDIKEEKGELWDDDDDAGDTKSKSSARNEEEDHDEDDPNNTATTIGEDGEEKDGVKIPTPVKKATKKEDGKDSAEGDRKASDEGSANKRSTKINTKYRSSNFIKLTCVHCKIKCVTFKEYQTHLFTRSHKLKMRTLALKCRERLLEMRAAQRNAQKDEDEKSDDGTGGEETKRPGFCMLCRLNYRQQRASHQQSEGHKMMKKFLMPYCNICNLGFKSPMAFETHRASLDHLKIKARVERYASSTKGEESGEEHPVDTGDIDLDSLTIVDEVGKVDEICEPGAGAESTPTRKRGFGDAGGGGARAGTEDDDDEEDDDFDEDDENQMIIGAEYVKNVQVQFCELCNMYLPRRSVENQERILRDHCKKRPHLKLYIRFRNDKKLREQAERIHKKKLKGDKESATGTKGDEKKLNDSTGTTESKPSTDNTNTASTNPNESGSIKSESDIKPEKNSSAGSDAAVTNATKTNASNTSNTTTVAHDAASVDSSEANLSFDGSNNLTALGGADVPVTLTDEQVDKLMWQVVDNDDLGDLLRDVQDDVEEEDDDKTNLERYDKFRHTEKNGLEQRSDTAADGVEDEEEGETGKSQSGAGKKGTAANGGADVAANGEAGKESKSVVG